MKPRRFAFPSLTSPPSGHRSDRYIWRYVKPDKQSLADAIDELD
jgi:hypothetical protein